MIAHVPCLIVRMQQIATEKRWDEARDLFYGTLLPIMTYLPGGPGMMGWSVCKNVLKWEGIIETAVVRAPSLPASETQLKEARQVWKRVS